MDLLEYEADSASSLANGSGSRENTSTGFVELTTLEERNRATEPVVVTTVVSYDMTDEPIRSGQLSNHARENTGGNTTAKDNFPTTEVVLLPRTAQASVQLAMTLLVALLVPAAFLTILCAPQYAFIITISWAMIILLFFAFTCFARSIILRDARAKIFHPYLHAVVDPFLQEIDNFNQDWKEEMLLLTDGTVDQSSDAPKDCSTAELPQHGPPFALPDEAQATVSKRRKPKSIIFRVMVKPFVPLVRRRKRRQNQEPVPKPQPYQPPTTVPVLV